MVGLLKDNDFWKAIVTVLRVLNPCMHVLRLADKSSPGMDRLYFYVRKTDESLKRLAGDLDDLAFFEKNGFESVYVPSEIQDDDELDDDVNDDDYDNNNTGGAECDDTDDDDDDAEGPSDLQKITDDDDESIIQSIVTENNTGLSGDFIWAWKIRRKKLVTDYAITGKSCVFLFVFAVASSSF